MIKLLHIPSIDIWINKPLESWHHGDKANPKNWKQWILFKISIVTIDFNPYARYGIGRPPEPIPLLYKRLYLYTRNKAYDIDIKID